MPDDIDRRLVDKRVVGRYLRRGRLDEKDHERYMKSLPDLADQAIPVDSRLDDDFDDEFDDAPEQQASAPEEAALAPAEATPEPAPVALAAPEPSAELQAPAPEVGPPQQVAAPQIVPTQIPPPEPPPPGLPEPATPVTAPSEGPKEG